jgi:aryl carrier-like protein
MVPQHFVSLDAFPLTANGKLDRAALPDPEQLSAAALTTYVAPRNRTEEILAAIWQTVLQVERVGVHDNFFALGGDSIRTLQVIARANRQGVKLTPKQLFEHQTVGGRRGGGAGETGHADRSHAIARARRGPAGGRRSQPTTGDAGGHGARHADLPAHRADAGGAGGST